MSQMPLDMKSALGPSLKLSRFFGLFPYEFDTFKPSKCSTYSVIVCLSFLFCVYIPELRGNENFDTLFFILWTLLFVVPWVTGAILLLKGLTIGSQLFTAVSQISKIELRFNVRDVGDIPIRSFFVWDVTVRVAFIMSEIYLAYLYAIRRDDKRSLLIRTLCLSLLNSIQNVYELQFLGFVRHLSNWFSLLVKRLTICTAVAFVECRKHLLIACRALEFAYNAQNFVTVSNAFLLCIADCYFIYGSETQSLYTVIMALRVVRRMYQVCVLAISAATLTEKADKFDEGLYTMLTEDDAQFLLHHEKVKEHMAQKESVIFTGGYMFTLDTTFLHSFAAVTANYLIIMIQSGGRNHKTHDSKGNATTSQ